jgi:hypothetical protein
MRTPSGRGELLPASNRPLTNTSRVPVPSMESVLRSWLSTVARGAGSHCVSFSFRRSQYRNASTRLVGHPSVRRRAEAARRCSPSDCFASMSMASKSGHILSSVSVHMVKRSLRPLVRSSRSPSLQVPLPTLCRHCGRSGRLVAHARHPARCTRVDAGSG